MNFKLLAFALIGCIVCSFNSSAQTNITIGTATTANTNSGFPCPLQDYNEGGRSQYLYRASELSAAGMTAGAITAIKFNVTGLGSFKGAIDNYSIKIGTTGTTSLSATTWESISPLSYYGPFNYVPVVGVNTFNLVTPFMWDGTSNIIVEICNGAPNNNNYTTQTGNPLVTYTTGLSFNGSHTYVANDLGNLCGTATTTNTGTQTTRPNIVFTYTANTACSATPVGGTAVSSQTSVVCAETSFLLSVINDVPASGLTYQWQSSTDNTTWTDIAGATTPAFRTTQTAGTYYRRITTCSNGGATGTSTAILVSNVTGVSGTFTINNQLPTGGTNFQSFNDAYNYIKCGINGPVTFNVQPGSGPYVEQLIILAIPGTSAANTVTFNGNNATLAFSSSYNNSRSVIKLDGAHHIRFNDLNVDATYTNNGGNWGWALQMIRDADSNAVRRCTLTGAVDGVVVIGPSDKNVDEWNPSYCDSNYIGENTIQALGAYYGITLCGNSTTPVNNNVISGNTILDFSNTGIYLAGTYATLVDKNNVYRPNRKNNYSFQGIRLTSLNVGITVSNNRIHDPWMVDPTATADFYGISIDGSDAFPGIENKVINNAIYNVTGLGNQYALYNNSADNAIYYHNTVSLDDAASASPAATRAFYQNGNASGIKLMNNLFSISRGGSGAKHVMYMAAAGTVFTADRNDYFVNSSSPNGFIGFLNGDVPTLTGFQNTSKQDPNSVSVNPYFTDMASGNLTPRSDMLDNLGSNVGITTDVTGAARSATTPDMGAFEFDLSACMAPPDAGVATAVPNSGLCLAVPFKLSLSGNSFGAGQRVQWQYSTTENGTYTNLGGPMAFPDTTVLASTSFYYRGAVTCGANTTYSTPVLVQVNAPFPGGIYTIDPSQPASATNFQNFTTASAALNCGIGGAVTFLVAPGTYTEQFKVRKIAGASATSRITFQSASGVNTSVTLKFAVNGTDNYVVRLDTASYITFKDMTVTNTSTSYGRVFELTNSASYDSITNCIITTPTTTDGSDARAAIYASALTGGNNVIKGNTITNGSTAIFLRGYSTLLTTSYNVIDSNKISGGYQGIYVQYQKRVSATGNEIILPDNKPNGTIYGIYVNDCDTSFRFTGNNITISNSSRASFGMYFVDSESKQGEKGTITGNNIVAITGNTGDLKGIHIRNCRWQMVINNVFNVKTTSSNSYGLHSQDGGNISYWNNTVYNQSSSTGNNYAAFYENYYWSGSAGIDLRNNIFAHGGTGRALSVTWFGYNNGANGRVNTIKSDYNMLYTAGTLLGSSTNPTNSTYATLQSWRDTTGLDLNSIVYKPAFVSNSDLRPDVTSPDVWAMNGRGVHIDGNDTDKVGNPRPVLVEQGVPDLGAYEFTPTSVPVALTPVPATPAAGSTQVFMMGTDTVMKMTWPAGGTVPGSVTLRRYSGAKPVGLATGTPFMYFYNDAQITGSATSYNADVKQYYLNPWMGTIKDDSRLKMGKTDASSNWIVSASSTIDNISRIIDDSPVTYISKFTGLLDPYVPPPTVASQDSSNMGTNFWVGYGHHVGFNRYGNDQDMVLYFAAQQPAKVTVSVSGTSWVRTYSVPANTVIISDSLPKAGSDDARLNGEGYFNRGIHVTSDVPVTVTTRIGSYNSTGASLLLPVGSYGYDYRALTMENVYGDDSYSWTYVVAAYNNTVVEITPSNPTIGGRAAGVPFKVVLNKGDVYNLLGAYRGVGTTFSYDMTGTRFHAVTNSDGKCLPFAVFSGSSHSKINCTNYDVNVGASNNYIQQNFPRQAWGSSYVLAPTSRGDSAQILTTNIFRVAVSDPATVVKRNGVQIPNSSLINGVFYQFESNTPDLVEADKPVTVAQFLSTADQCDNAGKTGGPQMIYLSPMQQGIKKAVLFRTSQPSIVQQYVTLVIPTAGLNSLKIDQRTTFSKTFAIPSLPGYTMVVQRWDTTGGAKLDSTIVITSDSAFTAITYGLGSSKTYGYNAGTLIKNLNLIPSISNTNNASGSSNNYTCVKSPFRMSTLINFKPQVISWQISAASNITPADDVTQVNPTPSATKNINGTTYYEFSVPTDYMFTKAGTYTIPIVITDPSIDGCGNSMETELTITVKGAPTSDFTTVYSGCAKDTVQFNASGSGSGFTVDRWKWDFSDATTSDKQNPKKVFDTAGTRVISLRVLTVEGCIGDTAKEITLKPVPEVSVVADSITLCPDLTGDALQIKNPAQNVTYNWYAVPNGGTAMHTGTDFTVTAAGVYYAEGVLDGCGSKPRAKAVVDIYNQLATPVVTVDEAGVNFVRFKWNAVDGAQSYSVSIDGGATFLSPSSGATGLTHTIGTLPPSTDVSIIVRANGYTECQNSISGSVTGRTHPGQTFIPNAFTPNGDGKNDTWLVYGYDIVDFKVIVFNQWGQRIFESSNQQTGWDGTYNGKKQPSGVYMYVVKMKMRDGSVIEKKGSINLVR